MKSVCIECQQIDYHDFSCSQFKVSTLINKKNINIVPNSQLFSTAILPLSHDSCPSKRRMSIHYSPDLPACPLVLWIDPTCAQFFSVCEIRLGLVSKMVSYGKVPASMFALRQIGDEKITQGFECVNWPVMSPSHVIVLDVFNESDTPQRFAAGLTVKIIV